MLISKCSFPVLNGIIRFFSPIKITNKKNHDGTGRTTTKLRSKFLKTGTRKRRTNPDKKCHILLLVSVLPNSHFFSLNQFYIKVLLLLFIKIRIKLKIQFHKPEYKGKIISQINIKFSFLLKPADSRQHLHIYY